MEFRQKSSAKRGGGGARGRSRRILHSIQLRMRVFMDGENARVERLFVRGSYMEKGRTCVRRVKPCEEIIHSCRAMLLIQQRPEAHFI
jgi:hypothetical protein